MSKANQISSACQFSGKWGTRRQEKKKGGVWALVQAPSPSWLKATKSLLNFLWATFKFAIDRLYFSSISLNTLLNYVHVSAASREKKEVGG